MREIQKLCKGFPEAKRAAWAQDQLADGHWADKRHGDRARQLLYDLAARPDCHLSAVSAEPAKAKGAYRLLENSRVTPAPPANSPNKALRPQPIHVVWVHEPAPAKQAEPLDWMLLTNLPVDTPQQCWEVVDLYKLRWLIEEVHLTLKQGLHIEQTQLKTAQRIEKLLAFCVAVAVLVVQLKQWSRLEPEAPCTVVLSDEQWRVLYLYRQQEAYPADRPPPTIREVVRWIGQLGGHLGRKGDGMPGVRTLWQGWCHLEFLVLGYLVAQRHAANGNATA